MKPLSPRFEEDGSHFSSATEKSATETNGSAHEPHFGAGGLITRVLLIDDDEEEFIITRDLLGDVNNGTQFELDWVSTFDEGLEAVARHEHDIYLLDYHLGTHSGIELIDEAVKLGVNAPMILMTGQGDPHIDSAATKAGAADYLVKGQLDTDLLERAIRYAIARKKGEAKFREAAAHNALLSAALAHSEIGVIITDTFEADHAITFVNPAFERITGYAAAEVMGKNPRFLQRDDDDDAFMLKMRSALGANQHYHGTVLNYRKDGSLFWNEMQMSPVRDADGVVIAWLAFCSDVTEKIRTETQLRESRENLAIAQRLTHLGSWIIELDDLENLNKNRIIWSDEAYRILGLSPQSSPPSREMYLSRVHEEDRQKAADALGIALAEGSYDIECRIFRPDGEMRHVRVRLEVQRDPDGRPTNANGTIHDVTEYRRAIDEARDNKHRLLALVEKAPLILWALDARGTFQFVEGQALELIGMSAEAYVGRSIFEISGIRVEAVELARQALAGIDSSGVIESNGRYFDVQYSTIRDEAGNLEGAVGVALDITERRGAQLALQESESHLRTILDSAPIVIWATDLQGAFSLSQGKALDKIGFRPGEVLGKPVEEVYGKGSAVAALVRRALGGEESVSIIEVGDRIFETHYGPTRGQDNRITGAFGTSYDITDRVSAQRERDESEARFGRIVENVPGMVYRFHRSLAGKMSFQYVSDGCREIYGLEPEPILADAHILMEIIHPDDLSSFFETIFESERTLEPWKWEGRITLTDGQEKWIRGESRPERQADGGTLWDGILVEVTANHHAREVALRTQQALNEAQTLAHIGSFSWHPASNRVDWSSELFHIFGQDAEHFQPSFESIFDLIPEEIRDHGREGWPSETGSHDPRQVQITRRDGQKRVLQTRTHWENGEGKNGKRLVGIAQDVTESVEAERALRESEQRYALAALGANDGLWDWNLAEGRIYLSPRWKQMLGYAEDEIGDDPEEWFSRVHRGDIERMRSALALHMSGVSSHFECEYRLQAADGTYHWMLGRGLAVPGESGLAQRIAGSQTDISQNKAAEAQLLHNAFYDSLTGLPNRSLFLDRLEKTIARAKRDPEYTFAVLFLDIDRFKKINDSLGHLPGDALLMEVAKRFETCLRPGDTVARLGGDEFAVLLDKITDEKDVELVAGRIRQELEPAIHLDGHDVFVTVSIGVAPSTGGRERADELLRNADTAMYRAKGLGRARHEVFDAAMHQSAVKMLELESDLWRAIERHELRLHYQPIVDLKSGRIVGYEALVRWQHPQRGLVPPIDFIPLAEESGLIVPIGWWVLEEACRQAQEWSEQFADEEPQFMAVNLSSKQFSQADIIDVVRDIVERTGFNPHFLKLEITESVIMENAEFANRLLLQLKDMGIHLSMDDFGTGYSSLSYLHRFPHDTLKIDRSFISQMSVGDKNTEIVGTILDLANRLAMQVVAEGVESADQLATLRDMGCELAQGYFFSRPLPPEGIVELLGLEKVW